MLSLPTNMTLRELEQGRLFEYNPEHIEVSALILVKFIDRRAHVLVANRHNPENRYPLTFPSGKLEDEEGKKAAAIRETAQETGIEIYDEEYLIQALVDPVIVEPYKIHYFFTYIDEAADSDVPINLEPDKHSDWKWISIDELKVEILQGNHPDVSENSWWIAEITQYEPGGDLEDQL